MPARRVKAERRQGHAYGQGRAVPCARAFFEGAARRTVGAFASGRLTPWGGRTRRAGLLQGRSGGGSSMGMLWASLLQARFDTRGVRARSGRPTQARGHSMRARQRLPRRWACAWTSLPPAPARAAWRRWSRWLRAAAARSCCTRTSIRPRCRRHSPHLNPICCTLRACGAHTDGARSQHACSTCSGDGHPRHAALPQATPSAQLRHRLCRC